MKKTLKDGREIKYDFCGFENAAAAAEMKSGKIGKLIGIGNSMTPILKSKQPVLVKSLTDNMILYKGDIVFCKVKGNYYLHKIHAIKGHNKQFLIGNNHGHMNGWIGRNGIFGKVIEIL